MDNTDWNNFFTNPGTFNYLDQQFAPVDHIVLANIDDLEQDIRVFNKFINTYNSIKKQLQDIDIKYLRAIAEQKEFERDKNVLSENSINNILNKTSRYLNPVVSSELIELFNNSRKEMHTKLDLKNQEIVNKITKIVEKKTELETVLNKLKELIKVGCESIDFTELESINAAIKTLECPVCTTAQIDCIVSDCGHTFCQACIGKTNTCPMCNTYKTAIQRIYFSS